jgi:hypothetical protein
MTADPDAYYTEGGVRLYDGYWLQTENGGVWNIGPSWYGSEASDTIPRPASAIVATSDGEGYDILLKNGGVWNFGNAAWYGSKAASWIIPTGVGVYGTFLTTSQTTADISEGWQIDAQTGSHGLSSSPWTAENSADLDHTLEEGISDQSTTVTWSSYWTVGAPTGSSPTAAQYYSAGRQAGEYVAAELDGFSTTTVADFVILDPEGGGTLPTTTSGWDNWYWGWQDGLWEIDPVLTGGYYLNYNDATYESLSIDSVGLPAFYAYTPIIDNAPSYTDALIDSDAGYSVPYTSGESCSSADTGEYVSAADGYGKQYQTVQFQNSGVPCAP